MTRQNITLIGVLKKPADLERVITERWYRIPFDNIPKRRFSHIAFYQPSSFGKEGKCISYYAKVLGWQIAARKDMFPRDVSNRLYLRYFLSKPEQLTKPLINKARTRITFAYTTLSALMKSKDILSLFHVPDINHILGKILKKQKIAYTAEYPVMDMNRLRYRLDFAIICKNGKLDIECDGEKWHSNAAVKIRDTIRNKRLSKKGWSILRLTERDVIKKMPETMRRINNKIAKLGGL